jgi:glycerol-3-phosphate dehydrogenase
MRAAEVLGLAGGSQELLQVFDPDTGAIAAEVPFAVREEMARTLSDILLRRTMVGLGPNVGIGADLAAAEIARRHLGWDAARADREIAEYRQYVQRFHPRILEHAQGAAPAERQFRPSPSAADTPTKGSPQR